jgi:hypothetical protein
VEQQVEPPAKAGLALELRDVCDGAMSACKREQRSGEIVRRNRAKRVLVRGKFSSIPIERHKIRRGQRHEVDDKREGRCDNLIPTSGVPSLMHQRSL